MSGPCLLHPQRMMSKTLSTTTKIRYAIGGLALSAVSLCTLRGHSGLDVVHARVCCSRFAILGALAIAATNLDVIARADVGMSGNVMVLTASIVVFGTYRFFLGAVAIGLLCGVVSVVHLRERAWTKMVFNCSSDALSLLGATAVFWLIALPDPASNHAALVLGVACAASCYLLLNTILVSIPVAISCEERYTKV